MIYIGPKFLSAPLALMTVTLGSRSHIRILKMLKFSFTFLRPYYFLTLSLNCFIFGLMNILHIAIPHPHPPTPTPFQVMSKSRSWTLIFPETKCAISGELSCLATGLVFFWPTLLRDCKIDGLPDAAVVELIVCLEFISCFRFNRKTSHKFRTSILT